MDFWVGLGVGVTLLIPALLYNYVRRVHFEDSYADQLERCKNCQVDKIAIASMKRSGI
jgi:hypothetical protein